MLGSEVKRLGRSGAEAGHRGSAKNAAGAAGRPRITDAERAAHRAFIATLGDEVIWNDFLPAAA